MNLDGLVSDLKPVRPAGPPWRLALGWTATALLWVAAGVFFLGARGDLEAAGGRTHYRLTLGALLAVLYAGALLALRLSLPGRSMPRSLRLFPPLALLSLHLVLALYTLPAGSTPGDGVMGGHPCTLKLLALGLVPGLLLFAVLRRLAAVSPGEAARQAVLAAAAAGAFGLTLHCAFDHGVHLVLYHGLPLVVFSFILRGTGRWLRW